ncbi:winged helix DNA-binding domain-containing protein [Lederbergia sp. NSJ-179]|uniref:DNA glycosylase AlkZ-like family protein n=1 Tax=Lederbergia sp. NSJ-179 TaxID=2931402 RepID=UPI001FD4D0E6|nr:crosslink repair DNA glycosylase YcaQ family protein [Lederbergia sp. NSJ-179]MCJ7843660.1 winged helix DNA-binding domain-containing protein [Lederbergia sp. NSJ-179]
MIDSNKAAEFAYRQGLYLDESPNALQLITKLVGIQSQTKNLLAFSARARNVEVDSNTLNKMFTNKLLERIWTVRGTMHTINSNDWSLFQKAFDTEWENRWSKFIYKHITSEQKEMLEKWIMNKVSNGPITRNRLMEEAISSFGDLSWVRYAFSSWGGLLKSLCYQNYLCFNPDGEKNEFVLRKDVGMYQQLKLSADDALFELFKRYINLYSPANYKDFVHWSGTTVKRLKQILNKKSIHLPNTKIPNTITQINILPRFDPYLLAHKDKFYIQHEHYPYVFKQAGNIEAVILKDGIVIGTWKQEKGLLKENKLFTCYEEDSLEAKIEEEFIRMKLINRSKN